MGNIKGLSRGRYGVERERREAKAQLRELVMSSTGIVYGQSKLLNAVLLPSFEGFMGQMETMIEELPESNALKTKARERLSALKRAYLPFRKEFTYTGAVCLELASGGPDGED